ncbi:PLP-dependent aminotransferase family protein [Belnapia sp. T18]|uniref:PLP-dependent aminotransferase family protein n=1 Tax=Belnapia arida TaxID=2804533 RepID=A0ABS1UCN9_9PROT|nr:PLP-dependent aminotransferase family protein [Belnapia arida]MBL6082459.1 PLP-dependent aminotransferase family protein [Belnapia arida]
MWNNFTLDLTAPVSRQKQIITFLRDAILDGRATPGLRLPSSRVLAADLGVSRQTVVLAYEALVDEGFATSRHGSGLFVADALPGWAARPAGHSRASASGPRRSTLVLSQRGQTLAQLTLTPARRDVGLLAPGVPALDLFPHAVWSKLSARFWRGRPGADRLGYTDPAGLLPLRQAIAGHLGATRGLTCAAEDIVVTTGSQQAIALAACLLLDPGDAVWVEEPAYVAGRSALAAAGARLIPVPVDGDGLAVEAGIRSAPAARLALVTPSHQYPLGVTMTLPRRLALLRWAELSNSWIVEDDYDGDYRYAGPPLRPLRALASHGASRCVVYVGTFAKVLAPALRLGFLVAPEGLAPAFATARALADRQSPEPMQATLADFIGEGHLSAHLRRMRSAYAERRDALLRALEEECTDELDWRRDGVEAGLHFPVTFNDRHKSDVAVSAAAAKLGLQTPPLTGYHTGQGQPGLVLGFGATSASRMADAARRLRRSCSVESVPRRPAS